MTVWGLGCQGSYEKRDFIQNASRIPAEDYGIWPDSFHHPSLTPSLVGGPVHWQNAAVPGGGGEAATKRSSAFTFTHSLIYFRKYLLSTYYVFWG